MMVSPVEEIEDVGGQLQLLPTTDSKSFADFEPQRLDDRGLDLTIGTIRAHEAIDDCEGVKSPATVLQSDTWGAELGDIRIVFGQPVDERARPRSGILCVTCRKSDPARREVGATETDRVGPPRGCLGLTATWHEAVSVRVAPRHPHCFVVGKVIGLNEPCGVARLCLAISKY